MLQKKNIILNLTNTSLTYYNKINQTSLYLNLQKNIIQIDYVFTEIFDIFNNVPYQTLYKIYTLRKLNKFLAYNYVPYWTKINFRGKGFRIRKFRKKKKITFNFGRSHWTKIKFLKKNYVLIKIRRQIYVFTTLNKKFYYKISTELRNIKPINHYTKRGLRLKKQYVKKRFGKISQVVSSLQF